MAVSYRYIFADLEKRNLCALWERGERFCCHYSIYSIRAKGTGAARTAAPGLDETLHCKALCTVITHTPRQIRCIWSWLGLLKKSPDKMIRSCMAGNFKEKFPGKTVCT